MKVKCPLLVAKPAQALVPATLRITDGRQRRVEPPRARVRAFQLTAEEARVVPNVVTDMFLFIVLLIILWYVYVYASDRYVLSELFACSCVI